MKYKRIFLLILDSLGIGSTNDSDRYGDGLANTLKNVTEDIELPNFKTLGLFELLEETDTKTYGYRTKANPTSTTKSSLISHLEMMDIVLKKEYKKLNLKDLDKDLYNLICTEIDRKLIIVNKDTDENIVGNHGKNQLKTGDIIIEYDHYNIKLFAHESSIPNKELIKIADKIMEILLDNLFLVNKIYAINFSGKPGNFIINKNKLNISIPKPNESILEKLKRKGFKIITIGKSVNIFNNNEMTNACKTDNDVDTIKKLIQSMSFNFNGLCISNLSSLNYCGHDRNKENYIKILKSFDNSIPLIVSKLRKDDLLIITSDQGNDPTYDGNDHTREKVPVLVFNTEFKETGELPFLHTLADIGATIADNFDIDNIKNGKSFLERLK